MRAPPSRIVHHCGLLSALRVSGCPIGSPMDDSLSRMLSAGTCSWIALRDEGELETDSIANPQFYTNDGHYGWNSEDMEDPTWTREPAADAGAVASLVTGTSFSHLCTFPTKLLGPIGYDTSFLQSSSIILLGGSKTNSRTIPQ